MTGTAKILLRSDVFALVDEADYEFLSKRKWFFMEQRWGGYAGRQERINGKATTVYMHRLLMQAPKGMQVDHINRNGLDNRRANLRLCTQSQNNANAAIPHAGSSQYRGVLRDPKNKKSPYYATIWRENKRIWTKYFATEFEAAIARDQKALEIFGEFATLNFPEIATRTPERRA